MKKLNKTTILLIFSILVLTTQFSQAQNPIRRSVNLELLGAHGFAGVSFDSRFKADSNWGYKVGLGYAFRKVKYSDIDLNATTPDLNATTKEDVTHALFVPMEVYYLVGKQNHFLELGAGALPVYGRVKFYDKKDNGLVCFGLLSVGYRYEASRWSIAPGLDMPVVLTKDDFGKFIFNPKLSIGYRL